MTNSTSTKFLKVSPRGFANEVIYFAVPADKITEAENEYAGYEDDASGRYCGWTNDKAASGFGVAIDWADRHWVITA